jgi:hypothetical protein
MYQLITVFPWVHRCFALSTSWATPRRRAKTRCEIAKQRCKIAKHDAKKPQKTTTKRSRENTMRGREINIALSQRPRIVVSRSRIVFSSFRGLGLGIARPRKRENTMRNRESTMRWFYIFRALASLFRDLASLFCDLALWFRAFVISLSNQLTQNKRCFLASKKVNNIKIVLETWIMNLCITLSKISKK